MFGKKSKEEQRIYDKTYAKEFNKARSTFIRKEAIQKARIDASKDKSLKGAFSELGKAVKSFGGAEPSRKKKREDDFIPSAFKM